jgi:hypothetical protein
MELTITKSQSQYELKQWAKERTNFALAWSLSRSQNRGYAALLLRRKSGAARAAGLLGPVTIRSASTRAVSADVRVDGNKLRRPLLDTERARASAGDSSCRRHLVAYSTVGRMAREMAATEWLDPSRFR